METEAETHSQALAQDGGILHKKEQKDCRAEGSRISQGNPQKQLTWLRGAHRV